MNGIGQLIITGLSGKELTTEERDFIQNEKIGGVILFSKNYDNPTQLAQLINEIQTLRDEYPLYISVDHEGGRVQRFKNNFLHFPPMLDIAKVGSPKTIFQVHQIMAEELKSCGINLNFSPCCDILTNNSNIVIGDRAFGKDKETVGKFITSAIRGLQVNGVAAVAKHFPGHGNTQIDSHFDLPVIDLDLESILEDELFPFTKAVKARVEMIMMGHLLVKAIDPLLPCTLSPKAYQLIRKHLKYTKLIITDDMEMKALDNFGDNSSLGVRALSAGCDIVLYRTFEKAKEGLASIYQSIKVKDLKLADIIEKKERVLQSKKELFSEYKPIYIPTISETLGQRQNLDFLNQLKIKIEKLKLSTLPTSIDLGKHSSP